MLIKDSNLATACAAALLISALVAPKAPAWQPAQQPWSAPAHTATMPGTKLAAPVALPDIPEFTGQRKFQSGTVFDKDTGVSCSECWLVNEEHSRVKDWYKQALQNYGWTITHETPMLVCAQKNSNSCTISVFGLAAKTLSTQLSIGYYASKK